MNNNMKTQFATNKNVIIGIIGSMLEGIFFQNRRTVDRVLKEYTLLHSLRIKKASRGRTVGIYKNRLGEKAILKQLTFRFKNLYYVHLLHEASLLSLLNKYQSKVYGENVFVPKLYKVSERKGQVEVIAQKVDGYPLKNFGMEQKLLAIEKSLIYLRDISQKISEKDMKKIPKKTSSIFLLTFPFYLFIAAIKLRSMNLFSLFPTFYRNYMLSKAGRLCIVHRDLHSHNILIKGKRIYIVDFEVGGLSDEETDVAFVPILYHGEIAIEKIMAFLEKFVRDERQMRRFLALTIFYTVQLLALQSKKSEYYQNASGFVGKLFKSVIPRLEKRIAELRKELISPAI